MTNRRPNHLRQFCQRAGISQTELARRIGVTPEWLSRIARGKAAFGELTERMIISHLNLTSDEANLAFHYPGPRLFEREEAGGERRAANVVDFPGQWNSTGVDNR